ncbi:unnamed protein product [Paramecium sonneborni]|uniref:Uncharacterized protein n=1 Tax=Paramecium sonneborni TaxID=65129 RepID=A0A8S1R1S8_9CILI|nr:unnamed protein product [Paramecium sonneborni]
MQDNQNMLEQNPNWQNKLKIIRLSADDLIQLIFERINTKKWKLIKHYRLLKRQNVGIKKMRL